MKLKLLSIWLMGCLVDTLPLFFRFANFNDVVDIVVCFCSWQQLAVATNSCCSCWCQLYKQSHSSSDLPTLSRLNQCHSFLLSSLLRTLRDRACQQINKPRQACDCKAPLLRVDNSVSVSGVSQSHRPLTRCAPRISRVQTSLVPICLFT